MDAATTPNEPIANGWEVTQRNMRSGRSMTELTEELAKLITAVRNTGKAGAITYKLTVKPASAGDVVTLQLEDDITTKLPRLPRAASIFFANDDGTLQRNDPRQRTFELRSVPETAPAPLVKAG